MSGDYDRLEREDAKEQRRVLDHSAEWESLKPVMAVNGAMQERLDAFCASKQITLEALAAMDSRVHTTKPGGVELAWAVRVYQAGRFVVPAIKYRDISNGKRRTAANSSWQASPIIFGNRDSLDVFVSEGETDAARLYGLVGDAALIVAMTRGALSWPVEWSARLPRGATIHLALDADEKGDQGSEKIQRLLPGAVRVRPPDGVKDWCQWQGGRAEFISLVSAARAAAAVSPLGGEAWPVFRDTTTEAMPYLIDGLWPVGATAFVGAEPKAGKTWIAAAVAVSCVTGRPLIGAYNVTRPIPVVYVALEGHRAAIRARIGCIARGHGVDPDSDALDQLHIIYKPRGLNLSDPDWARWLCEYVTDICARLVLVDTLRSATTIRESNEGAGDMARLLKLLSPITSDHVSVGFLHHFSKLNEQRQQRAAADRMTGTGALRGHMDFGLFITKSDWKDGQRRMRVEVEIRDGVEVDPFGLRLTGIGTGAHGGLTYLDTARLEFDEDMLGEAQVKAPSGEIAEWIREQPGQSATPRQICDQFDISTDTLSRRRNLICANGITYYPAGRLTTYHASHHAENER